MTSDAVFLDPKAKIEPLVAGWYAWTHLLSPATHAYNVAYRHLPLMQSFIQNPGLHVAALRNRANFGGPFVGLGADRVEEVRELLAYTQKTCARSIELARQLKALDTNLQSAAKGYSMSALYAELPESLQGLVELVYDLNDHPKLRLEEKLLRDEGFAEDTQTILLSRAPEAERPFFISTPRLASSGELLLPLAFNDARIDLLASMRTRAQPFSSVCDALEVPVEKQVELATFFTRDTPPRRAPRYAGEEVRVRYFGHASVLIETREVSILLDPMVATELGPGDGRFNSCDLPDHIDYVALSHGHQDHFNAETLLQLRHRIGTVLVPRNHSGALADPSMALMLASLGFRDVVTMDPFDEVAIPDGRITSLPFPGEHVDLDVYSRHGIHVAIKGRKIAFLVDSDGHDRHLFRRIARRVGKCLDAVFLGMECEGAPLSWLYGPLLTRPISRRNDESRRLSGLNAERAWNVINEFEVGKAFVYAMGQEPWLKYIMGLTYTPESIQIREVAAFLSRCQSAGLDAENLFISAEMYL